MRSATAKLFREPLLHFLVLGLGLFLAYGWLGDNRSADRIVITRGKIAHLVASFEGINQRAPSADELDALLEEAVREEVYYREAKALGLDEDDTIVRRRLRQKLEFVSEDIVLVPEPTVSELQEYLRHHPEKFRSEARYSLSQVYLDPQLHGQHLTGRAQSMLSRLRRMSKSADSGELGDPFLLQHRFSNVTGGELARLFGAKFEAALRTMPTSQWRGPLPSPYGMHLVFVEKREADRAATLRLAGDAVRREWIYSQRKRANERFYADLRKRYEVIVEPVSASAHRTTMAAVRGR